VTFRGDNDEAFRRAAAFVGDTVGDLIRGEGMRVKRAQMS
jgi:hypothetical protein